MILRVHFKDTTHEKIKKYILDCDVSMLNVDFIQYLLKCLPQPYQIDQLCKLKDENTELSEAESFFANICNINRLVPRLMSIQFKICFDDMVARLMPDIELRILASEEVISSKKFAKVLSLILSIGNIMNSGSTNGQAVGYDLATLTKLNDIKSTDKKKTLLIFLVETISDKFPELLNFGDQLKHVGGASRINMDCINDTFQELKASSKNLMSEIQNEKCDAKFLEVMSPFASQLVESVELLATRMNQMQNKEKNVAEYLAFDINKFPMATCFSNIQAFKDMFEVAKGMIRQIQGVDREALVQEQNNAPIDGTKKPNDMPKKADEKQEKVAASNLDKKSAVEVRKIKDICHPFTIKLDNMTAKGKFYSHI